MPIKARQNGPAHSAGDAVSPPPSAALLANALDRMSDAFVLLDREWRIVYANPEAVRLNHKPAADFLGKTHWEEWPASVGTNIERQYRRSMAEGVPAHFEHFYEGEYSLWLEIHAYPTGDGLAIYYRDITDRKLAEAERDRLTKQIEEERALFKTILDHVPMAVGVAEAPSGRIVMGNPQVELILGHPVFPSENVEAYSEWIAFHADGRRVQGHEWPLARALQGEFVQGEEFHYQRGDGIKTWIRVGAAPIRNAEGLITGSVVVYYDIDREKRTAEALLQTEKLAVVGRLAASIAHEINNPLESVTNLLYLLAPMQSTDLSREYLEVAREELARVSQIASQTLRFQRDNAGAAEIDFAEIARSVLALFQGRIHTVGIHVAVDIKKLARPFVGSAGGLRQVLVNLIGNALDASKPGGRVIIRVRPSCDWKTHTRPGVRITVADTGCGMPPEIRRRVYEPFFSTKSATGTGLGLWVTAEIVNKHGGSISVWSSFRTTGRGTAFSVFLPYASDTAQV